MFCGNCGKELDGSTKFCESCGAPVSEEDQVFTQNTSYQSTGQNMNQTYQYQAPPKKPFYKKWWVWAIAVFVLFSLIVGPSIEDDEIGNENASQTQQEEQIADTQTDEVETIVEDDVVEEGPTGINADLFDSSLAYVIEVSNTDGVIDYYTYEIIDDSAVYIKLYLSDSAYWTYASDVDKKDFLNSIGEAYNTIACSSCYEGTDSILGVNTKVYSPGGTLLGEYTMFGNAKVYE